MGLSFGGAWSRWIITAIGLIGCALFVAYGVQTHIFTSQEALESFLAACGVLGPIVFILVQAVQVIVPIIPGGISCLGGVIIFGPVYGFIYNYVGICIGSIGAFLIAKSCGKGILTRIASEKTYDKYVGWISQKGRFDKLFALAIFLPVAPDDFLCYLAGTTKMTLKKFILIILLCKPASIALYSLGLAFVYSQMAVLF